MRVLVNGFSVDTTAVFPALLQVWVYIQVLIIPIRRMVASMAALNAGRQKWTVFIVQHIGGISIVPFGLAYS